ncbi:MAG: hypothetical protein VYC11_06275, partial [Candidatus Thermoplasmatota archaeon]|nr:hypothetical protein [Candidatus Thermoplasmatota archaeon]
MMLRFSFFSDTFIEYDGWYIDNVGVVVDWFESNGSWTSDLILDNENGFAPSLDIDAHVPDGTWVKATVVPISGLYSEPTALPLIHSAEMYHVRIDFGTSNHQLTPRIMGLHSGAVRILNSADGSNGWKIPSSIDHSNQNLSNPTLTTVQIPGESVYGDAPIEEVSIISESAGALFEIRDGQGVLLANGALTNQSIVLPYATVNIRPTISLQPGGWLRYASFTGHLGAPMTTGSLDIGGDGNIDWTWDSNQSGSFGWYGGLCHPCSPTETQFNSSGVILDAGVALVAGNDITWTWANGDHDSLNAGQIRILEYPQSSIQNQSNPDDFVFMGMATSWHSTTSITELGPSLREIQSAAINGTGSATIDSGQLQIPINLQADVGGVSLSGVISHAPRIENTIISVPDGTMVPEQNVYIITSHSHLFDRNLFDVAILRLQSNTGVDIEVHVENLSEEPVALQIFGAEKMELLSVNIIEVGVLEYQLEWNLRTQWAFDDADTIQVLAEAIEADGFALGPAHSMIGGSNHQAMENDLEIVSWHVRDEKSRLLSNEWDTRYPFHAKSGSSISVTGKIRFEGQAGLHPTADSYTVGLEIDGINGTSQSIGNSGAFGDFSANIALPNGSENISISP